LECRLVETDAGGGGNLECMCSGAGQAGEDPELSWDVVVSGEAGYIGDA